MAIQIEIGQSDDAGFILEMNQLVNRLATSQEPDHIWVIEIDGWFDHKWLRYSGYGLATSNIPLNQWDTVKAEFWQDKVTFPPFSPSRVLGQWSFSRTSDGYVEFPLTRLPHSTDKKMSAQNLHRRIGDFDQSACFMWYSSGTLSNGRGSVMVYSVNGDQIEAWFAAFTKQTLWTLINTKGASLEHVKSLLTSV